MNNETTSICYANYVSVSHVTIELVIDFLEVDYIIDVEA